MKFIFFTALFSFILIGSAFALPKKKAPTHPEKVEEPKKEDSLLKNIVNAPVKLVDSTQGLLDENVTRVANRLDSFFGNQRADDELNRSQIRLIYAYTISEAKPDDDFAFRVNLRLQNLEDYFKSLVEKSFGWQSEKPTPQETQEAVKKLDDPNRWLFRQDVGVIASVPPRVFYRTRLRKTWVTDHIVHRFVEELGWYSDEQWIDRTTFESDRALDYNAIFRIYHEKNWAITDKEFTTSHGPSIIHIVSARDAISYNARALTRIKGPLYLNGYNLNVTYRRRLRGNWLYGDITPALDFPKSSSFRRAPSILMRVEILFGGIREDLSTSQSTL